MNTVSAIYYKQNVICPANCSCLSVDNPRISGEAIEGGLHVECRTRMVPTDLPNNTTQLVLLNLQLRDFPSQSLAYLSQLKRLTIRDGSVWRLKNDSFVGLNQLTYLYVNNVDLRQIDIDTFSPLRSILVLDMSHNTQLTIRIMTDALYGVRHSPIKELYMDAISQSYDIALTSSYYRNLQHTNISLISLQHNGIVFICNGFLPYIPRIQTLILSNNFIHGVNTAFIELLFLVELRVIDISYQKDHQYYRYEQNRVKLGEKCFQSKYSNEDDPTPAYIDDIIEQHSDITAKIIDIIGQNNINLNHISDTTEKMDQSIDSQNDAKDKYTEDDEYNRTASYTSKIKNLIKNILQSSQDHMTSELMTRLSTRLDHEITYNFIVPFLPKLERIYIQRFSEGPGPLFGCTITKKNSLKYVDTSHNWIPSIDGAIKGLIHMEFINLQSVQLAQIPQDFFKFLPNLTTILISENKLSDLFENDINGTLFSDNHYLHTLDISQNRISTLSEQFMKSISNISIFRAERNNISHIIVCHFTNLLFLDISSNEILEIEQSSFPFFANISSVNMTNNPVTSSRRCCDIPDFILWTRQRNTSLVDADKFVCLSGTGQQVLFSEIHGPSYFHKHCRDPTNRYLAPVLAASLVFIVIITVTMATLMYRKRWTLRWIVFFTRRYWKIQEEFDDKEYTYDAFVAYCIDDVNWVKDKLIHNLEQVHGLSLCVHHRDFMVGMPIEENIVDAIVNSRKTILVISKAFVGSHWCNFEVHMARNKLFDEGRDILVPIVLEKINHREVTGTLCNVLAMNTYIAWADEVHDNDESLFWAKLVHVFERRRNSTNTINT